MLGRLFKHELKSYGLPMGIIFLAGGLMTIFMKILSMLPYNDNAKDGLQMLMVVGFILAVFLMSIAVKVIIAVRFYNTTVCDQAYLTWTIPAKTSTILWSKLLGGIFWRIICVAAIVLLGVIFFSGSYWLWHEELTGMFFFGDITPGMLIHEFLESFTERISSKEIAGFIMYYIGAFIWSVAGTLLIYMCIGIGQLFGKFRIIASIGFYFLIIILTQIVSTIGVAVISNISFTAGNSNALVSDKYGFLPSIISLALALIVNIVLFAITNIMFDKHLNLD